jgi:DNA-binding NarL/FixJ family response regulator
MNQTPIEFKRSRNGTTRAVLPSVRRVARPIRTFLAEDSPPLMVLLARIMGRDERTTIVGSATDGQKAFRSASTLQPDLVLTDLHLPGLDGAAVTRLLKQLPNPPIVFVVSSDDAPEGRTRCQAAGADAFLLITANLASRLSSAIQEFFPEELEPNVAEPKLFYERLTTVA